MRVSTMVGDIGIMGNKKQVSLDGATETCIVIALKIAQIPQLPITYEL